MHERIVLLLDGVGAGAALPLAGGEVGVQLGVGQLLEEDDALFLPDDLHVVRATPEDDAGPEFVLFAAEGGEDASGVGFVVGLADDAAIDPADGVGGKDETV